MLANKSKQNSNKQDATAEHTEVHGGHQLPATRLFGVVNRGVRIVFPLLYVIAFAMWAAGFALTKENYRCTPCLLNSERSRWPLLLCYSCWSLWLSMLVFFPWVLGFRWVAQQTFRFALPHSATVMLAYLFFVAANQADEFIDREQCYSLGRSSISRQFDKSSMSVIDLYLVLANVTDVVVHYLSAPLMVYLWLTGELIYDVILPRSTFLFLLSGSAMAIAHFSYNIQIYCGDFWFNHGCTLLLSAVVHTIFVLLTKCRANKMCGGTFLSAGDGFLTDV